MSRTLRLVLTVDPYIPVPPTTYGGFERVVAWLVEELVARGHDVTLFAHPDSRTPARLIPYGKPPHTGLHARSAELAEVGWLLWRLRRHLDLVHSFGRLAALAPVLLDRWLPKIQSYGREIAWPGIARGVALGGRSLTFTACSSAMWRDRADERRHGRWVTVYNGVDLRLYTATVDVSPDAPLVFLGRVEEIKGVHHAIAVARRCHRRLIIAGNRVDDPGGRAYFDLHVRPHLDDPLISYVGPVDDEAKNRLLGGAAALLMLIDWEEPFGIVMAEAMACGTPVIGFSRGSVPEVVDEGATGFVVADIAGAVAAVSRLGELSRSRVRTECARRFSHVAIVDQYEALYYDRIEALRRAGAA